LTAPFREAFRGEQSRQLMVELVGWSKSVFLSELEESSIQAVRLIVLSASCAVQEVAAASSVRMKIHLPL
jgi:hypothetical protein